MEIKNKNYDLRGLSKKYPNKWVALSQDHKNVLVVGKKLKEVASKTGKKDVIFLKLSPANSFYMPATL
ncbi:MAG: hypothetical protein NT155_04110 [Candidatus Staskawiczbacteria bacterium]|nr:hypothetical protein [Candidatus Staskawiczbacteria bacterium]